MPAEAGIQFENSRFARESERQRFGPTGLEIDVAATE
jgi:hypothetical protein